MWGNNWSDTLSTLAVFGVVGSIFCFYAVNADEVHNEGHSNSLDQEDDNSEESLSHGFGENIDWKTLKDGFHLAAKENKNLMLIIHKSWCGACKALKPKFAESAEIAELSEQFVMVNVADNDEPQGQKFSPDGGYIPRILFFDPKGNLMDHIVNESGNPDYKYYYFDAGAVATSMKRVLSMVGNDEFDFDSSVLKDEL